MSASTRQKAALRRPPAFQCYASDDLARATYYQLTLAERGLLDAMRRVYWVEDLVPTTAEGIALAVRRPVDEVRAALTDRVLAHFTPAPFNAEHLICRVLAGQMSDIIARREKQSAGGKKGAKSTNNPRTKPPSNASNPTSRSSRKRSSTPAASEMSGDEVSGGEHQWEGDNSEYSDEYEEVERV